MVLLDKFCCRNFHMICMIRRFFFCFSLLFFSSQSMAGLYADSLRNCLTKSITHTEKRVMVQWVFSLLSMHPDLNSKSKLTEMDVELIDRSVAGIFTRLISQACRQEALAAYRYENPEELKAVYGFLGQEAMKILLSDTSITQRSKKFTEYLDSPDLRNVMSGGVR